MKTVAVGIVVAGMLLSVVRWASSAGGVTAYELSHASVQAGGGHMTGGDFDVLATVGYPSSSTGGGGAFEVTGGVWVESPRGDCAYDGAVTLADYTLLAPCLLGPASPVTSPACGCFDTDASRAVDLRDVAAFQRAISAP